jgi:predicted nucleotidyltransferase component of viral defense system
MIELLLQKLSQIRSREEKFNVAREYLQILVLKILSDAQAFQGMAFIGGTALRILFQIRRYSKDLDFSVTSKSKYKFDQITAAIARELELQNLAVDLKTKAGVVDNCMIHFTSVLQEAGIAVARDQKLSVKLEIDTSPPAGATFADTVVNADFIFPVRHYDVSSLMAGKLHAVIYRRFNKGRDFYDLLWYLSRKTQPNLKLLSNAIFQSEKERIELKEGRWIELLKKKLSAVDYRKVRRDLAPFIHDSNEVNLITAARFEQLLLKY